MSIIFTEAALARAQSVCHPALKAGTVCAQSDVEDDRIPNALDEAPGLMGLEILGGLQRRTDVIPLPLWPN